MVADPQGSEHQGGIAHHLLQIGAPKIAPCPLFPESDATSDPWLLSRRVTGVVAVSPCSFPL
jgi:hypothetical protein